LQKLDHNIGFLENRQFFRRKLAKIAENCDQNQLRRIFWHRIFEALILLKGKKLHRKETFSPKVI
jgi:hypothetical protein